MDELTDVKPCPFCGKPPTIRYVFNRLLIECDNRKCPTKPSTWLHVGTDSIRKLVSAWNMRKEAE